MIGIFDSGSGGLTVLAALRKRAPKADALYFGDIANAPYGERSAGELARLTEKGLQRLTGMGTTQVVSACNSLSLSVLMGATEHLNVIEMTRPVARMLRSRAGARMLLLATPATIESRMYPNAVGVTIQLDEIPVPKLAGVIEFGAPENEIQSIVHTALSKRQGKQYDGIILGCTHYPLVRDIIEREATNVFGPVEIIDPGDAVAEEVMRRFDVEGSGKTRFLISKDSDMFRKRVSKLFTYSSYTIEVV